MADWYYAQAGKKIGPISPEQLKQLANNGQLRPDDSVWKAGSPKWVPASSINGLFGTTGLRDSPSQGLSPLPGEPGPTASSSSNGNAHFDKLHEIWKKHWAVISGLSAVLLLGFCSLCLWVPGFFSTGKKSDAKAASEPMRIQGRWSYLGEPNYNNDQTESIWVIQGEKLVINEDIVKGPSKGSKKTFEHTFINDQKTSPKRFTTTRLVDGKKGNTEASTTSKEMSWWFVMRCISRSQRRTLRDWTRMATRSDFTARRKEWNYR